ncbi:MAG: type II toxin-antitoxin system VapC family toxin [Promethearchaeota archaeon]
MLKIAVFLDTGFYLGLCHPKDKHAEQSKKVFIQLSEGTHGLLYTSSLIISEVTTLVAVRTNSHPEALNLLEEYLWGANKIAIELYFNSMLESEIWELFKKININKKRNKNIMSFVDVSSIILCKQHQIEKIVSFNSHFDGFLTRIY